MSKLYKPTMLERFFVLPIVRQSHTWLVKQYIPSDSAPESFKNGLYDFKYRT